MGVATRRVTTAAIAGAAGLAAALLLGASWSVSFLISWDVASGLVLTRIWFSVWRLDAAGTADKASAEDDSRAAFEAGLISAGVASLVADGFVLAEAGRAGHAARIALVVLAVASVLLAWAVVHTVYMLRYARLYYTPPAGGFDFHDDGPPDYRDLAYVALTLGMCYQVSDTDITKRQIRRAATHHALLSYLFGTIILAVTVGTVAGLLGS